MNILAILLTSILFNNGWMFSKGDASSMQADYTHGTEYFTYIAKAQANGHNKGPIMLDFDDSAWQKVSLPHDWVVDLPYSKEASHSHGYKCIGWKYPQNSVGWYRKVFDVPAEDKGKRILIEFEGIFRNSQVFCNGFYLGGRQDGYLQQVYDLTDYLDYGQKNIITVRCDASLEEGWYYEGAGIYRNVFLIKTPPTAIKPHGVKTLQAYTDGKYQLAVEVATTGEAFVCNELLDAGGNVVARTENSKTCTLVVENAREWSVEDPYLYTLRTVASNKPDFSGTLDTAVTRIGLRRAEFSAREGFLLNGKKVVLKGCNLHQDHAGVGAGIPDGLWKYRLEQLKKYGFNTIRSSHNPASPTLLNLADEMGFLVIDENRELGTNDHQLGNLRDMILRDINHPGIIIWSVGNEEWALEGSPKGKTIVEKMSAFARSLDPTRPCTYANAGGREMVKGSDVFGYNYIVQNPVEDYRKAYPTKTAIGTEETSGAGTRGKYVTVAEKGWMEPLNRRDTMGVVNAIGRGWKFYHDNTWTAGLCYWTGFDYRGESNPMVWPATGSQFGILDYCGYPKDEAYYLKSWWTDEPVLHICGITRNEIWVYSNCDVVEMFADKKTIGSKRMPKDGFLSWKLHSSEGVTFSAEGTYKGKKIKAVWPDNPPVTKYTFSKDKIAHDGQDIIVVDIDSPCERLSVKVQGAEILGWGNGNPGFKEVERPLNDKSEITVLPFSGKCQVILRSIEGNTEPLFFSLTEN